MELLSYNDALGILLLGSYIDTCMVSDQTRIELLDRDEIKADGNHLIYTKKRYI